MKKIVLVLIFFVFVTSQKPENLVSFNVFHGNETFSSFFNESLVDRGCKTEGNFSFVVHGWYGSGFDSDWIPDLIVNLQEFRGGCIIFMNYSFYSDRLNYLESISFFKPVSSVLLKKLWQMENEGISGDSIFMFGFSFGGRIVIDAGVNFGRQKIHKIDICEAAAPGFDKLIKTNPQHAAKNVQCIHTSSFFGTSERKCHQDWSMGICGTFQPVANEVNWLQCKITADCLNMSTMSHHTLCPVLYNLAFKNDFTVDNYYNCESERVATATPEGFKMGFMETRRSSAIQGEFFAPTSMKFPFNRI